MQNRRGQGNFQGYFTYHIAISINIVGMVLRMVMQASICTMFSSFSLSSTLFYPFFRNRLTIRPRQAISIASKESPRSSMWNFTWIISTCNNRGILSIARRYRNQSIKSTLPNYNKTVNIWRSKRGRCRTMHISKVQGHNVRFTWIGLKWWIYHIVGSLMIWRPITRTMSLN